eukprot:3307872-Pleurochrysis_carterae.AAC.4
MRPTSLRSMPFTDLVMVKTQGSDLHWAKPKSSSHGNNERCQRRPAWAIPYIGFSTRQMRGRPSSPVVACPGGA